MLDDAFVGWDAKIWDLAVRKQLPGQDSVGPHVRLLRVLAPPERLWCQPTYRFRSTLNVIASCRVAVHCQPKVRHLDAGGGCVGQVEREHQNIAKRQVPMDQLLVDQCLHPGGHLL